MKEKRILCTEVGGECRFLEDVNTPLSADAFECQQGLYCTKNTAWKPITKDTCKNCKEGRYQGFTRKQTIEKMAKAMLSFMFPRYYSWAALEEDDKKYFRKSAEAALNELLEGKK